MTTSYRLAALPIGTDDTVVTGVLRLMHDRLWRQAAFLPKGHSASYYRKQLEGTRSMSLSTFVAFLRVISWLGNRVMGGTTGRRWVAQILQLIADEYDLVVTPKPEAKPTKAATEELCDFAVAGAQVTTTFARITADGRVTTDERSELTEAIERLKAEADDLPAAVSTEARR